MPDLNAIDLEGAMRQVEGTARSMGIESSDQHRHGSPPAEDLAGSGHRRT